MTIQQISVFLENKAGELSQIISVLAENKVDLRAINIAETSDYGVLRLIAADPQKASNVLLENGFVLSITPVMAVLVPDEPGGLAKLLKILADAGLDIQYMYSVFNGARSNKSTEAPSNGAGSACMIFRIADMAEFAKVLEQNGIESVSSESIGV